MSPAPDPLGLAASGEEPDTPMRLPRPAPGTGKWWAVGVIGCGLAVIAIVWIALASNAGRITSTTVSYQVVDNRSVVVDFDVTVEPGTALVCEVRAMAANFAVVGSVEVPVPPSSELTSSHRATVRTASLAVTGIVYGCRRAP